MLWGALVVLLCGLSLAFVLLFLLLSVFPVSVQILDLLIFGVWFVLFLACLRVFLVCV